MSPLVTLTLAWASAARDEFRHRTTCQTPTCETCRGHGELVTIAADHVKQCRGTAS